MYRLDSIMTDSIAPPDPIPTGDPERPKRIFKVIVIGDSHVGRNNLNQCQKSLLTHFIVNR